jgi:hypothetical protein
VAADGDLLRESGGAAFDDNFGHHFSTSPGERSSTKHQIQRSPGSMERISGCFTAWKCLVACLFFEESQQPIWPQIRHKRKCSQRSPIATHSGQTCVVVVVIFISSR